MFRELIYSTLFLILSGCTTQGSLQSTAALTEKSPQRIALLVPLSGPLGHSGQAIRNGFFTAYYQQNQNTATQTTLRVYDTTHSDIRTLYQKAIAEGATFVVGPLAKDKVKRLDSSSGHKVPTLALNNITGFWPANRNIVQFGLSPATEAAAIAKQALAEHYSRALIIAPANEWAENITRTFIQNFKRGGGQVTAQLQFTAKQNLNQTLKQLLQVKIHTKPSKKTTDPNETEVEEPNRRQDIDLIFLAAPAEKAREILPLLRFYYAGDLPVYATSLVYTGFKNQRANQDLNGVIFSDMPWILNSHPKGTAGKIPRLFALGTDAYTVALKLSTEQFEPFEGKTGYLELQGQTIHRTPRFATFKQGLVLPYHPPPLTNTAYEQTNRSTS